MLDETALCADCQRRRRAWELYSMDCAAMEHSFLEGQEAFLEDKQRRRLKNSARRMFLQAVVMMGT